MRDGLGDTELLDRALESDRRMFGVQAPEAVERVHRNRREPEEEVSYEDFSVFDNDR